MINQVLEAKTWRSLGVPKTKDELRKFQRELHPDKCSDPRAKDAFAKIMALFEGPDYDLRVAAGQRWEGNQIVWTPKSGFEDRLSPARVALTRFSNLEPQFAQFFPRNIGVNLDKLTAFYGKGWWFLSDYEWQLDSRTIVWIAKRLAGALNQSNRLGIAHCNIHPITVAIMPSDHGLMIDGWWSAVSHGKRLVLKPDTKTPSKYLGGTLADDKIDIAQSAAMLLSVGKPDKMIAEQLQKNATSPGDAVSFFKDIDNAARTLYGKNSWHPLALPKTQMI